jgi:CheY-like chemotaxis protein
MRTYLKTILLVEDSDNDIELLTEAISEEEFADDVIVVKNGQQALDFLSGGGVRREPGNPILVMLDLKLPQVHGLEVLRRVKSDPQLKNIPIVVFTSSHEESDLQKSYALGANAYVVKPGVFDEYKRALQTLGAFWTAVNQPPPDRNLL